MIYTTPVKHTVRLLNEAEGSTIPCKLAKHCKTCTITNNYTTTDGKRNYYEYCDNGYAYLYPDTDGDKQPTYCYSHGNYDDMDILKCFQTDNFDQAVDMANRYYEKFTKFYTVGKDCGSCLMDMRWDMAKDEGFFKCEAPVHAPPLKHTNELTTVGDI